MGNTVICVPGSSPPGGGSSGGFASLVSFFRSIVEQWVNPFLVPPRHAQMFHRQAAFSVAPAATVTILTIELEASERARLSALGLDILDDPAGTALTGFQNCTWELLVNGVKDPDFGSIVDQVGRGFEPSRIFRRVEAAGSTVELKVTNNHGSTTFTCFGRLDGWAF